MRKFLDKLLKSDKSKEEGKKPAPKKRPSTDSGIKKMSPGELKRLEYAQKFQEKFQETQEKLKEMDLGSDEATQELSIPEEKEEILYKIVDIIADVCETSMFQNLEFNKTRDITFKEDSLLSERSFDDAHRFDSIYLRMSANIPMTKYKGTETLSVNPSQLSQEITSAIKESSAIQIIMDVSKPRLIKSRRIVDKRESLDSPHLSVTEWRQKRRQVDKEKPEDMLKSEYYTKSLVIICIYFPQDFWIDVTFSSEEVTSLDEMEIGGFDRSQQEKVNKLVKPEQMTDSQSDSLTHSEEEEEEEEKEDEVLDVSLSTNMFETDEKKLEVESSEFNDDEPEYYSEPTMSEDETIEIPGGFSGFKESEDVEFKEEPDFGGEDDTVEIPGGFSGFEENEDVEFKEEPDFGSEDDSVEIPGGFSGFKESEDVEFKEEPDFGGEDNTVEIPGDFTGFGQPVEDDITPDPHLRDSAAPMMDIDLVEDGYQMDNDFDVSAAEVLADSEMQKHMEELSESELLQMKKMVEESGDIDSINEDLSEEEMKEKYPMLETPDPATLAELAARMKGGTKQPELSPTDEANTVEIRAVSPAATKRKPKQEKSDLSPPAKEESLAPETKSKAIKPPSKLEPPKKLIPIPKHLREERRKLMVAKRKKAMQASKKKKAASGKPKLTPEQRKQFLEWMKKQAEKDKKSEEENNAK